ncbi:glycosyltransferase family 2 protein [Methylovulum psychrotolerans]|uniref:Polyprenol monophosphomannose synthase n=1 Tax=Methylovulum psychrotolerans TaxID=1704499 RepID=A0A2S5CGZ7_9GAMM|nr:glycosyltransferase family 2 protein [Methylovulum psychrotolerans]POZ50064.1 Polyprenol monophosphomannose synthase [Methylovulum psychrotolerans]
MKTCIVIPVYNHHEAIGQVTEALRPFKLPCLLINDGSSAACGAELRRLAAQDSTWLTLHEREKNGGKGAAVITGLQLALAKGFTHAIQIDADGQHCLDDIRLFLSASAANPDKLILGAPRFDGSASKKRLYGRQFTNLWIWINTLSFDIRDGMCGFRCYPLAAVGKIVQTTALGQRMDFDIEIAVRLHWDGVGVVNIDTDVRYPLDGVSHFRMLDDNLLISKKHAQLFFGMLWRLPRILARRIR